MIHLVPLDLWHVLWTVAVVAVIVAFGLSLLKIFTPIVFTLSAIASFLAIYLIFAAWLAHP